MDGLLAFWFPWNSFSDVGFSEIKKRGLAGSEIFGTYFYKTE